MRLSGVGVAISSAGRAVGDHACGLVAATSEKRDHSPAMLRRWSAIDSPAADRRAFSNIGYAWDGTTTPRDCSNSLLPGRSLPSTRGRGTSSGWDHHDSHAFALR